ncbi:MAG TPA: phosphate-starvation-inducible PsiE family protein [Nitrospira sp.]|nr:phosphate-starvation-inducible PsiE family protein [Nitrospira sp.]
MDDPVKIKALARFLLVVYEHFRQCIAMALMVVLMVAVTVAIIEGLVAFVTVLDLTKPLSAMTMFLSLRELFAGVLLVLLGLGLMESVKVYLTEDSVHVEVVLLVALIAVSRSLLLQDFQSADPLSLLGLAALLVSLTGGYFLLTKAMRR